MPASQEVEMDMKYCLAGIGIGVHYQAKSPFSYVFSSGDLSGNPEQMTDKISVFIGKIKGRGDVFFGNDERMHGCLRIDILKGNGIIVLIDYFCRDFF